MKNNRESGLEQIIAPGKIPSRFPVLDYEMERKYEKQASETSPDYSEKYSTIPEVIKATVARFGERPALVYKNNGENSFITYSRLDNSASAFALALMDKLSVKKGDHIAMVMDNSPDWMIANLGIQYAGAADVPRAADTPNEILETIIPHSDSRIALVQDLSTLQKLPNAGRNLDYIVVMDHNFKGAAGNILSFSELMEYGMQHLPEKKDEVLDRIKGIKGDDLASIIYSSGTTGTPKGAMLTQGNYMNNIEQIPKGFNVNENDRLLSVLPVWHAYERQVEYVMLGLGASIFYGSIKTLMYDLNRAEHTILAVIPDILNVLYKATMKKISTESNPLERMLAPLLIAGAKKYDRARRILNKEEPEYREESAPVENMRLMIAAVHKALYAPLHSLAQKEIYSKIQEKIGGKRLRIVTSGAGPLPSNIDEFFSAGRPTIPQISEGYGMTETIVVDFARDHKHNKIFTVGKALSGIEFRIVDEDNKDVRAGEIGLLKIRGPNVMKGYYKEPELTSRMIDSERFLSTGDLVRRTIDDYVRIIGRNDDTIVLTKGEKVNPALIENELIANQLIDSAVVIGDRKPYLAAHVYLNSAEAEKFAKQHSIKYFSLEELETNKKLVGYVREIVFRTTGNSKKFAKHDVVKRVVLHAQQIPEEFLSQTRKLKRKMFNTSYSDQNEEIYRR